MLRQWNIGWSTIEGLNIWAASRCRLTKVKFCDHIKISFNKVVNLSLDFILELVGWRFGKIGQQECWILIKETILITLKILFYKILYLSYFILGPVQHHDSKHLTKPASFLTLIVFGWVDGSSLEDSSTSLPRQPGSQPKLAKKHRGKKFPKRAKPDNAKPCQAKLWLQKYTLASFHFLYQPKYILSLKCSVKEKRSRQDKYSEMKQYFCNKKLCFDSKKKAFEVKQKSFFVAIFAILTTGIKAKLNEL